MKIKGINFFIAIGTIYILIAILLGAKLGIGFFLLACLLLAGIMGSQWLFLFPENVEVPGIGTVDRRVVGTITLVSNTFVVINLLFCVVAVMLASNWGYFLVIIGLVLGGIASNALLSWDRQTLYLKHSVVRNRIIVGIISLQLVIFWIVTYAATEIRFGHKLEFGAAILVGLLLLILLFIAVTFSFWVLVPIIFLILQKVSPEEVIPLPDNHQDQPIKQVKKNRPLPAQDRMVLSKVKDPKSK